MNQSEVCDDIDNNSTVTGMVYNGRGTVYSQCSLSDIHKVWLVWSLNFLKQQYDHRRRNGQGFNIPCPLCYWQTSSKEFIASL